MEGGLGALTAIGATRPGQGRAPWPFAGVGVGGGKRGLEEGGRRGCGRAWPATGEWSNKGKVGRIAGGRRRIGNISNCCNQSPEKNRTFLATVG